jgi:hypothetical protein
VLQIELAANTIVPDGAGTKSEFLVVAHLRCAPEAARAIRDAIDRALEMPGGETAMMPMPATVQDELRTVASVSDPRATLLLCALSSAIHGRLAICRRDI